MATVHLGRLLGPVGFARTVAIKRLHAQYARDPEFVSMFLDEARLAARIRHPNVVSVLDIVAAEGELFLVMDFVVGDSLSQLVRAGHFVSKEGGTGLPARIAVALVVGVLQGVHAAHETRGEKGELLDIVHRDISPQNVLVGHDGAARLIDFGIAKALGRLHASESGVLKGKLAYMAPEQVQGVATRRSDIFSTAIVLWELLTGHRLFAGESEAHTYTRVIETKVVPPSVLLSGRAREEALLLEPVLLRALSRDPAERFHTAREFALALEAAVTPASTLQVADWVATTAGASIDERLQRIREVEEITTGEGLDTVESFTRAISSTADDDVRPSAVARATPTATDPTEILTEFSAVRSDATLERPRRRLGFALATLVALAGLGALAFFLRGEPTSSSSPPVSPFASAAVPEVESAVPSLAPLPAAPALPDASAVASGAPAPSAPARKPTKRTDSCKPPYVVDAQGHRHFKPNCF